MCVCLWEGVSVLLFGAVYSWFLVCSGCRVEGSQGRKNFISRCYRLVGSAGLASLQWWSVGALFPGPSLSRIRELMGQGDKGSLSCVSCLDPTPTETPVEFVGVAHTNVTEVGGGCGESLKTLGGKKRNKAVKEADH